MLHSLFIINSSGDIVLEKHWKSVIHRSICDYFFQEQKKATNPEDIPPIISTPHHYMINVYQSQLHFVSIATTEVPPLTVIEFLYRIVDTIKQYFDTCSENTIKENYVTVFELLDEMCDNGFPLATELNVLQELIKPDNLIRKLAKTVTGKSNVSETLPTGTLSNIPWRRAGVKYTNNEAYFDVIEELDAIVDKNGTVVTAEIQGYIDCAIKLSGMPDLSMNFMNPRILDDVSFHPCVRFKKWENERLISFIPPDGQFRLMSYHIGSQNMVAIPLYIRHSINFSDSAGGKIDITVGPKQSMGKVLEDVILEINLPKSVQNCLPNPSQGKCVFDTATKLLQWEIGKIEANTKPPNIKGPIHLAPGSTVSDSALTVNCFFKLNQIAISGLKVNKLDMYGEKYKPFKGVKYLTKAGRFQFRT